jgi:hypothetical protein
MKYTITKRIGSKAHHFQVEGNDLFEVVREANKLSFPDVPACGVCGSDHLDLQARVAQDQYKYTYIKCLNCKAELTFGQKKSDAAVYYLRKDNAGNYDWKQPAPEQPQHPPMHQPYNQYPSNHR